MNTSNSATYRLVMCCLLACFLLVPSLPAQDQGKPKEDHFAAMAMLPSGAGRRMIGAGRTANVDLYVNSYTSDDEAKQLAGLLIDGGPNAVFKQLEKMKSIGKITLTGRVGFYDLKFIRSRPTETGRRITAVTDRPIGFLEAFNASPSEDYKFGIIIIDLKTNKKGKEEGAGEMIYAAKIKLIDGNKLEIENYGVEPVKLMSVRKL